MFLAGPCTTRAQRRPGRRRTERPVIFVTDVVGQAGSAGPAPSRSDLRLKAAVVASQSPAVAAARAFSLARARSSSDSGGVTAATILSMTDMGDSFVRERDPMQSSRGSAGS